MKSSLQDVLNYKHDGVVKKYSLLHKKSLEESELIFSDLMRFFWASGKHEEDKVSGSQTDFVFIMDEAMRPIDDIWHVFLLYTKDYMEFCDKYYGEFIHHLPDIVPNLDDNERDFDTNLSRFLDYNYDLLGEETIKRWFAEA